jgi:hypothetical protein
MNRIFIFVIILHLLSCKKKKLNKVHPEMQGLWKHWIASNEWEAIDINEHGAGKVRKEKNGENIGGDVSRAWYIKDDYLMWSWKSTIKSYGYKIDKYPTTSDSFFITGLDTVKIGSVYVKLDGNIYINIRK